MHKFSEISPSHKNYGLTIWYILYLKEKSYCRMFLMVYVWKANMFIYQTHRNEKLRWNTNETNFRQKFSNSALKGVAQSSCPHLPGKNVQSLQMGPLFNSFKIRFLILKEKWNPKSWCLVEVGKGMEDRNSDVCSFWPVGKRETTNNHISKCIS